MITLTETIIIEDSQNSVKPLEFLGIMSTGLSSQEHFLLFKLDWRQSLEWHTLSTPKAWRAFPREETPCVGKQSIGLMPESCVQIVNLPVTKICHGR